MATALEPLALLESKPTTSEPDDPTKTDPRVVLRRQFHEALRSRMHEHIDKDGSFFSYMFLDKLLNTTKRCRLCGAKESGKLPDNDTSLQLFVAESGVVGRQNLECTKCKEIYPVTSCEDPDVIPDDSRLAIQGLEIRYYCKRITHYEVLHDLMEMLHIAAMDDGKLRRDKHIEVADFMLQNARKVCEEWCKPEYAELRQKKYLRLREETLLTTYNPTFTPDCSDEYREMYEMMAGSFRQNRGKVLLLLELLKESLIDNPTRPSFMMWVSIAMMHSENYQQFKTAYDPRAFMRVDSTEYQALKDRYLALNVPLGIKKIPVVFLLFEIPRFYHYVDFITRRLGKRRPKTFLTDEERIKLAAAAEQSKKLGIKRKPKSGKLVSPEAHLDFLTRKEEIEREMIYKSCRDKEKKREKGRGKEVARRMTSMPPVVVAEASYEKPSSSSKKSKRKNASKVTPTPPTDTVAMNSKSTSALTPRTTKAMIPGIGETLLVEAIPGTTSTTVTINPSDTPTAIAVIRKTEPRHIDDSIGTEGRPMVMSTDDFKDMLVEHLRANEESVQAACANANVGDPDANLTVAGEKDGPSYVRYSGTGPLPEFPGGNKPPRPVLRLPRHSAQAIKLRKERKAAKKNADDKSKTVLVAQVDTDALRRQGFKVSEDSKKTTLIASKDGKLEHILEGFDTPDQIRAFLAQKYNVLSQQQGTGYVSLPTRAESGGFTIDSSDAGAAALEAAKQAHALPTSSGPGGVEPPNNNRSLVPVKGNNKKKKGKKKQLKVFRTVPEENLVPERSGPEPDDGMSGFPFTSDWTEEQRQNFREQLIKGIGKAVEPANVPALPTLPNGGVLVQPVIVGMSAEEYQESNLNFSEMLMDACKKEDGSGSLVVDRNKPNIDLAHTPLKIVHDPDRKPGDPVKISMTTKLTINKADGGKGVCVCLSRVCECVCPSCVCL